MDGIRVLLIYWDTRQLFDLGERLSKLMLDITKNFADSAIAHSDGTGVEYVGHITVRSLNEAVAASGNLDFTHAVIMAAGCVVINPQLFCKGIQKQITGNPGMCLSAQILHTGRWPTVNDERWYTLHEQLMVISKHALDHLRDENIVINDSLSYRSSTWPVISRSDRNVHDDYTPLDIWCDDRTTKERIVKPNTFGVAERLIEYCLGMGWHVQNINADIRVSKIYSYHTQDSDRFLEYFLTDRKDLEDRRDTMLKGHYEFFKNFDYTNRFWAYNTEDVQANLVRHEYDCFVGVASGLVPWAYMATYDFADDSVVSFVDIDPISIRFQKWFLDTYETSDQRTWDQLIDAFIEEDGGRIETIGDMVTSNEYWSRVKPVLDGKWEKIRNYTFHWYNDNMISSSAWIEHVSDASAPMVWFSNIFRYLGTISENYKPENLQDFLNVLITANRNVTWVGSSIEPGTSLGPNSTVPAKHCYKKAAIPTLPTIDILDEIARLEELDLFTKHRGSSHPGWSSFVVHGLGYDKTLGYEYYGYKDDASAPYDWTPEAMAHVPTLVGWLKSSGIKDRYHRVRIMKLAPQGYIGMHDDDPNRYRTQWALNIAINQPPGCEMHFWDNRFNYAGKVPWEAGDANFVRIHWPHMVRNLSQENRYHIIIHGAGGLHYSTP